MAIDFRPFRTAGDDPADLVLAAFEDGREYVLLPAEAEAVKALPEEEQEDAVKAVIAAHLDDWFRNRGPESQVAKDLEAYERSRDTGSGQ